jgi:hypothetical protein
MTRKPKAPDDAVRRLDETTTAPTAALPEDVGAGVDVPDVTTLHGDDMARRAFLSAVFGLLAASGGIVVMFGLLVAIPFVGYSGWLLLKLMAYSGELSPAGMRRMYGAIALDAIAVFFALTLVARVWWW